MVYITKVHMSGGEKHEHIAKMKWRNPETGKEDESTRQEMVDFIEKKNGSAKVKDGSKDVDVLVVDASPKYVRTRADGKWTDNLLALPRY